MVVLAVGLSRCAPKESKANVGEVCPDGLCVQGSFAAAIECGANYPSNAKGEWGGERWLYNTVRMGRVGEWVGEFV